MKILTTAITFLIGSILFLNSQSTAQNSQERYDLMLKMGHVNAVPNLDDYLLSFSPEDQALVNGNYYKIIQFYNLPDNSEKNSLEAMGIGFLEYIPNRAYVVSIPADFDLAILKEFDVRNITDIIDDFKQDLYLLDANYPDWALRDNGMIDLMVTYYSNIPYTDGANSISGHVSAIVQDNPVFHLQIVRAQIAEIGAIVATPEVFFVEPVYPEGEPENTTGKTLHRSNVLSSEYETGRHYDGEGVKVMLQDDGFIGPHIDYQGRIGAQNISVNYGNHGDHCAGTIFGYGNLDPTVNGMATGAELHTWGAAPEYPGFSSIPTAYSNTGIRISSTSYSNGCNAGYTSLARTMDLQSRTYGSLIHVFSAGNAGSDNCGYGAGAGWGNITGGHKIGKNVIATANVDYTGNLSGSSSRGPAHDGRIKPDISAKGSSVISTIDPNDYANFSGTSMACPGIAGSLAQLYQAYRELNNDEDPPGGFMKALIMNTATDLGNIGPDFKFGWGQINNRRAVEALENETYMTDEISQDDENTHEIDVPEGVREMKVMVYWTDKEASVGTSLALVNNLDITITDPSSGEHLPWLLNHYPHPDSLDKPAVKGTDALNNVEQVQIDDPAAGTYTLHVAGTDVPFGPQEYYVIYDFVMDEIEVTYPIGGEAFAPGESIVVRWDAFGDEGTFTLEYSVDNGSNWTVANSSINGGQRHLNWSVPSEVTSQALVRISRDGISDTGEEGFIIMGIPSDIEFERACPESVLLAWDPVDEAVSYDVMMLGEKYMEVVGSTSADTLLVEGISYEEEYWFTVRAIGPDDAVGRRAMAVMKSPGVWNCLFTKDIALSDVISPPTGVLFGCQDYSDLPVQVEIKNSGADPMSGITVHYEFENEPTVSESLPGTLEPGETVIHVFASSVSLPGNGIYDIKAWIEVAGDENGSNNEVIGSCKLKNPQYLDNQETITFDEYSSCGFADNCEGTICYIDNLYYNMQNGLNDDIDWRVLSGITPTPGTGPIGDHTTGTSQGKFLYLEASGDCYNQKAILTTPCADLTALSNPGLTFWFHMNGDDQGSLHVDVVSDGVLHKDVMAPLSGNWGNQWNEGHAYLWQFAGKEISIRFRGYTGDGELSDLAIDDLMITEITGVDEFQSNNSLDVFPNPSSGTYNMVFREAVKSAVTIRVLDVTGRTIHAATLEEVRVNQSYPVDISPADTGIYYLIVETADGQLKEKLLKY